MVARLREAGIEDERVLAVMAKLPRHWFLDEAFQDRAYSDDALPIGFGQTLSQPYVVARMTELVLGGNSLERVLEIGTGSGYQSAVLSRFCEQVYSIERIAGLASQVAARLKGLGINNVELRHGDGFSGWEEMAPFDGIVVTAAPGGIPLRVKEQLAIGGRMVVPVGSGRAQTLTLINRGFYRFDEQTIANVTFVPMRDGVR